MTATATGQLLALLQRVVFLYPPNGHGPLLIQPPHDQEFHRLLPLASRISCACPPAAPHCAP